MPEGDFLCDGNRTTTSSNPLGFSMLLPMVQQYLGAEIRALNDSGYTIHRVDINEGNVALVYNGGIVGFYHDEVLEVRHDHQGKGLSVPLVLEAVPYREAPIKRTVSAAGEAALRKAWRVANSLEDNPWP